MIIFKIEHLSNDRIAVFAAAATEIKFEVELSDLDYMTLIRDICQIGHAMMDVDADLMELHDGADVKPNPIRLMRLRRFARTYKDHLRNVETDLFEFEDGS